MSAHSCHVSHVTPRALRAGARARREAPRPDRLARDKPTNTPHGACQLGEGQTVSSLAFERRLSHSAHVPLSAHGCAVAPHDCTRAPVRRAAATVARLTPRDSVACAIVSIRARSPRSENRAAIFFSTAPPAQPPTRICDQACCPLTSPLRRRSSGRQAPRCRAMDVSFDGETGDHVCLVADVRATAPAVPR